MLGAIIGDVAGSRFEFKRWSRTKDFELFGRYATFTDDTVMTVAIADALLKVGRDAGKTKMARAFVDSMQKWGNIYLDVGYGGLFYKWLVSSNPAPYGSYGNGSAMRTSACGWFFDTLEETERIAGISAAITHNHPEGIKGAQATAGAIFMARNGSTKDEIKEYIETTYGYNVHRTWEDIHWEYYWHASCQGTVPQALIAFLTSSNFEDAIRRAVSLGGDSDTLACITGGIAEAYYKEIPKAIVDRVSRPFPRIFNKILEAVREETVYGKTCKIVE